MLILLVICETVSFLPLFITDKESLSRFITLVMMSRRNVIPDIHFVLSIRLDPGFRPVRVTGSGRLAFVIEADGLTAVIAVNQPSDCMALQRQHVVCSEVDSIDVWFGYRFTSQTNGPKQPESPEVWQTAVHHLLNTYRPRYCFIYTGGTETGLPDDVRMEVNGKRCYRGFWDHKQHVLSLRR